MVRRLLHLNGLAIIGVVLYHASGWGFTAMFWWTDRYLPVSVPDFSQLGSFSYYALRGVEQLIIFSIPAFLFVSGFFIAFATRRKQETIGWRIVGTRIKNLVIPYLIWSGMIFLERSLQGQAYTFPELATHLLFGRAAPPYYFVPLLAQLYLISPFLVPLARRNAKWLLLITGAIQIGVAGMRYWSILGYDTGLPELVSSLTPSWFFGGNMFWFTFGMVTGFHLPALKNWLSRFRWSLLATTAIMFPLGMLEWELLLRFSGKAWLNPQETLLDGVYIAAFILSFLAFDNFTPPFSQQLNRLGSQSYGIFLIHLLVLELVARSAYHLFPSILAHQVIFQPLLIASGLGVPLAMMWIVKRTRLRGAYAYLFG